MRFFIDFDAETHPCYNNRSCCELSIHISLKTDVSKSRHEGSMMLESPVMGTRPCKLHGSALIGPRSCAAHGGSVLHIAWRAISLAAPNPPVSPPHWCVLSERWGGRRTQTCKDAPLDGRPSVHIARSFRDGRASYEGSVTGALMLRANV